MKVFHGTLSVVESGQVLATTLWVADGFWSRFRGLQGRWSFARGHALLIVPCRSVHTFWMTLPIDVAAVTTAGKVLDFVERLEPWQTWAGPAETHAILEYPGGTIPQCKSDHLRFLVNDGEPQLPTNLRCLLGLAD